MPVPEDFPMLIDRPGLYQISAAAYHSDVAVRPSLSSTLARKIHDNSALHAWTAHPRLNPDWEPTESKTFDIGRAAHRAVLGAGADYVEIPADLLSSNGAVGTKAAKAFVEECRAAGLTPLVGEEIQKITTMAEIVRRKLASMRITIDPARSELCAFAEIEGVWCRSMLDNAPLDPKEPIRDFKTTKDASPEACIRAVMNFGYDMQAAFYQDAWEAATGERRRFQFIFQEKSPPYDVSVVELHDDEDDEADWMLDARHKCAEARRIWGECLRTGQWPGYPARVAVVGAPAFHRQKWADRAPIAPAPTRAALSAARQMMAPHGDAA